MLIGAFSGRYGSVQLRADETPTLCKTFGEMSIYWGELDYSDAHQWAFVDAVMNLQSP